MKPPEEKKRKRASLKLTLMKNDIDETFRDAYYLRDEIASVVIAGITHEGMPFVFSSSSTVKEKCTIAQYLSAWCSRWFFKED